jgi:hypothetical protein
MENLTLSSTWTPLDGQLSSSLTILDSIEQFSLDQVTLDNCVQLAPGPSGERCELVLSSEVAGTAISNLVLVSSCPRWEVVGDLQYLMSLQGSLMEDCSTEDLKVFLAKLHLKKSYSKICLRLPPSHSEPFWLFSVQAVIVASKIPFQPKMPGMGHFDLGLVNSMLEGEGLSERAEKFKNLFDNFQSSHKPQVSVSSPPKMEDLLGNPMLLQTMLNTRNGEPKTSDAKVVDNEQSDLSSLIKSYIDMKFTCLQSELLAAVDKKFEKQNTKIDRILELLEKRDI